MTTVADLVAKLGFQVDTRGFDNFKKSLQAFQSIVRDGLKDLKEYAKQAEKISKAFKEAYLPSRSDAEKRYRAETYAMRARAYAQRIRARNLPETLAIRRYNAEIRDRQTSLKEAGLAGAGRNGGALLSILGMLSGGVGGVISGGLTALGSAIGGPVGAAVALAISKLMGSIVRGLISGLHWLWGQIKQGLSYAMSFRDYKAFTGRSSQELRGLMGMAQYTTSMTPQDIMKDATRMGREYWDMWFGGGNPAIWQMLGVMPTTSGKANLQNLLGAIYKNSGGLSNRGLALSLLKQAGLDEDYMNILERWNEYQSGGGERSFIGYTDEEIERLESANKSLRQFSDALDRVRVYFVDALLKSGLQDALKDIADYLLGLIQAFRSGKIHDASSFARHFFAFDQMAVSGASGRYISRSEFRNRVNDVVSELKEKEGANWFERLLGSKATGKQITPDEVLEQIAKESIINDIRRQNSQTINNFNNNIDMSGRSVEEGAKYNAALNKEQYDKATLDAATIMAPAR